ncbi:MAG: ABC transporter permease [Rhodospirillaceae bacterium]
MAKRAVAASKHRTAPARPPQWEWQRPASIALGLGLWAIVGGVAPDGPLPGPVAVWDAFLFQWQQENLLGHLLATLRRVVLAFVLAYVGGCALGLLMGLRRSADRWLDAALGLFLNMPALVVIILCYVWFGLTDVAAVLAVAVNKLPLVAVTVREGARARDRDLEEMGRAYALGPVQSLRHIVLPQLAPFFLAAARSGLSLVWKIVLVVELLGRSDGIGFQLGLLFQLFDIAGILAVALSFIAVVQVIEALVMRPLDRVVSRRYRDLEPIP